MRRIMTSRFGSALLALSACLLFFTGVLADSGPAYDLSWWTVDSGGATSACIGAYCLGGTIGQPDAGVLAAGYTLYGGFWGGVAVAHWVYLPLVLR
jgi:hypothetical protein